MTTLKEDLTSGLAGSDWVARERLYTALTANVAQCESYLRRALWMLILSGVSFFLIASASVSEVEILGVKFGDISIVEKGIPVIASYFFMEFMGYTLVGYALVDAVDVCKGELWPSLRGSSWIASPTLLSSSLGSDDPLRQYLSGPHGSGWALKLVSFSDTVASFLLFIGTGFAIIWAYVEVFTTLEVNLTTWLSLAAGTLFMISAFAQVILAAQVSTRAE